MMENKSETTTLYRDYIRVILGLYSPSYPAPRDKLSHGGGGSHIMGGAMF